MLKPEAIRRRADLAAALNDELAGRILSCGRGELLHVIFLDAGGHVSEFPALTSESHESASEWSACAERAVRMYVMR